MARRRKSIRKRISSWWKTITTGKKLTFFLMLLLTEVIVFAEIMMYVTRDISVLDSLTAPILSALIGFAIYMAKSAFDHKNGVFDGHNIDEKDDPGQLSDQPDSVLFPQDNEEDQHE